MAAPVRSRVYSITLVLALGLTAFFVIIGPRALNPQNIAWLETGDPVTHYLGWAFFRAAPWEFPLGLNPSYGLELSNSVLYSDSNPLLAFLFKPFSPLLPDPFQYFGLWLLICFVLQAWFGWKLMALITDSTPMRLLGAGLFVFAPPMILRMGGHLSLATHFLILAALYLALVPTLAARRRAWGILLGASALVHAYIFAMLAAIWIADLSGRTIKQQIPRRASLIEFATLTAGIGFLCWQAGYFSVGASLFTGGFGIYQMDFLSIFDSNGWSYLLKDIPQSKGDQEGFNYLGLGLIFLLIPALPILIGGRTGIGKHLGKHQHLLILFVAFSVFALSNHVTLGPLEIHYPLPKFILKGAGLFRASGRFFWPVFYAIVFTILFLVIKGYEKRTATSLLTLALAIQVLDTSAGWGFLRQQQMIPANSGWNTSLTDPFWAEAASTYQKLRYLPVGNYSAEWQALATFASAHGLATDAVYLARVGNRAYKNAVQKASKALESGYFDADSLYVLDDASFFKAAQTVDRQSTLLARIDGFNILAPGWKSHADHRHGTNREIAPGDIRRELKPGERVGFGALNKGASYLGSGWSVNEDWGAWSNSRYAVIFLPVQPGLVKTIHLEARVLLTPSHPQQRLKLSINGISTADLTLTEPAAAFEVALPETVRLIPDRSYLKLEFHLDDAFRPKDIGLSDDARLMALGLVALTARE